MRVKFSNVVILMLTILMLVSCGPNQSEKLYKEAVAKEYEAGMEKAFPLYKELMDKYSNSKEATQAREKLIAYNKEKKTPGPILSPEPTLLSIHKKFGPIPELSIFYKKDKDDEKLVEPISVTIRERAWVVSETEKDYTLNALTANNVYEGNKHNKFTTWQLPSSSTIVSGGYAYGYGYGLAFKYPSLELVFKKNEVKDIDWGYLGISKDNIFVQGKYKSQNINYESTKDYLIIWINLNNVPDKFLSELSYVRIEDD